MRGTLGRASERMAGALRFLIHRQIRGDWVLES